MLLKDIYNNHIFDGYKIKVFSDCGDECDNVKAVYNFTIDTINATISTKTVFIKLKELKCPKIEYYYTD